MTDKNISLWKIEEFLIDNLKELPIGNGKFKLKATTPLEDLIKAGALIAAVIDRLKAQKGE